MMHHAYKKPSSNHDPDADHCGAAPELSELTGNSQASLVSELLEGQEVVFARVIQSLEAAKLVKEEMKSSLRADLDRSQQVIEAQLGLVLEKPR